MSNPHITYAARLDTTPGAEIDTLASVYAFILNCGEARRAEEKNKAAGRLPSPDDRSNAKEIKNGCAAESKYNR